MIVRHSFIAALSFLIPFVIGLSSTNVNAQNIVNKLDIAGIRIGDTLADAISKALSEKSSQKVAIFVMNKNALFDHAGIDLATPHFFNPSHHVPIVLHSGVALVFEGESIILYYLENYPENGIVAIVREKEISTDISPDFVHDHFVERYGSHYHTIGQGVGWNASYVWGVSPEDCRIQGDGSMGGYQVGSLHPFPWIPISHEIYAEFGVEPLYSNLRSQSRLGRSINKLFYQGDDCGTFMRLAFPKPQNGRTFLYYLIDSQSVIKQRDEYQQIVDNEESESLENFSID